MKKQAESVCKSGGVTSGYYAPVNIWDSKRSGPDGGCAVLLRCSRHGVVSRRSRPAFHGNVTMKQKVLTNRENMT